MVYQQTITQNIVVATEWSHRHFLSVINWVLIKQHIFFKDELWCHFPKILHVRTIWHFLIK